MCVCWAFRSFHHNLYLIFCNFCFTLFTESFTMYWNPWSRLTDNTSITFNASGANHIILDGRQSDGQIQLTVDAVPNVHLPARLQFQAAGVPGRVEFRLGYGCDTANHDAVWSAEFVDGRILCEPIVFGVDKLQDDQEKVARLFEPAANKNGKKESVSNCK